MSSPVGKVRSWNCSSANQLSVLCFPHRLTDNSRSIFVPNLTLTSRSPIGVLPIVRKPTRAAQPYTLTHTAVVDSGSRQLKGR